jgi:arginase family enzyme
MNFYDYFDASEVLPIQNGLNKSASVYGKVQTLGVAKNIVITEHSLVIFGVKESRNSNNIGASQSPDAIRSYLYSLSGSSIKSPLVDLGNLKVTASPADTYMAIRDVIDQIVEKGATCIILGGTQEITWPVYLAISQHKTMVNVSIIDQTIDMGNNEGDFSSTCYIEKFIGEPYEKLLSLNMIGFQNYLTDSNHIKTLSSKNHELARLGYARGSMNEIEPTLRDSDIISFDIGCIKQSDSPGAINPSPNGFYSEEVCQLARYSGLSSKVKAFGLFEFNPMADRSGQSAHLSAQIIWHFIDAFNARKGFNNIPLSADVHKHFYVKSTIPNVEFVFIQNTINDSWWIELPATEKSQGKPTLIACSYNDYIKASNGDIPERWLRAWKKMT